MLPDAGDIAWVEFGPILGTEQAGRRPALFITALSYHQMSYRSVVCPITTTKREWPFDVALPLTCSTRGFVLVDQVRTIDRSQRMFDFVESVPLDFLAEVRGRLASLLGIPTRDFAA
ncbi:type II toxin-antitoxin system PemK/MazF family toxin [Methyloceanibacter sp.]|uniref:type II toxin-antitoxin system PemK/MazF family toxin n=1 Tax=Methyloceanibacter sp. TaxID=1965321 RepID=UPI003D6D78DB